MGQIGNSYPGLNTSISDILWRKIDVITRQINALFLDFDSNENLNILVAGCGDETEAKYLKKKFLNSKIEAIDIAGVDKFEDGINFSKMDLAQTKFKDNFFDLIYCYHVLEHVSEPKKVLYEFERILKNKGVLYIGFPNRNRLLGYIGVHKKTEKFYRIKANLRDFTMRLRGRFRNEYGAHAGFTNDEFIELANTHFKKIINVRNEYFLMNYPKYSLVIKLTIMLKIDEIFFPSNYYICIK